MDDRQILLEEWLQDYFKGAEFTLTPLCGDASFRRYFRIKTGANGSFIAMDAPPDKESILAFVHIARSWHAEDLHMPEVFAESEEKGFLLLSDFGDLLYLTAIKTSDAPHETADRLYQQAFTSLLKIQRSASPKGYPLPKYDRPTLLQEMRLFTEWLLPKTLNIELTKQESTDLERCFKQLVDSAMMQPQHPVHRDYHSRNLMVIGGVDEPAILDFQDAVIGPVTYDLVSLLRDCYIAWPEDEVERWVRIYYDLSKEARLHDASWRSFQRWFDLMGIQRHLKAAGIFSRLMVRDGKPGYLADIPQTLRYLLQVSSHYKDMKVLHDLLETKILPIADHLLPKRALPDLHKDCKAE